MATDYKKIAEEHKKDYGRKTNHLRFYKRLYNDKTHFVYELIQNADDSKSEHLELQLDTKTLLVWNDGRQFDEADVRNICSIGSSDKDLTQIGNFGIGFKAVYNYTDVPEIYSGDERFRIHDFIKPEGIDEMPPEIARLVNEGKTVFRLPFKDILRQEEEITRLENRLRDLSKERSLLFLRHLERIAWKDERSAQTGSYSCHRYPHDKIQNASEVELTVSLNGSNRPSETFLIFRKEVQPPQNVTNELLYQAEDVEERQRIQRAATKSQSVEVAFKLQDGKITAMGDNCVLFAYLPTQKETHLKFLIQARYQTTPSRDNIPKPSENPWNKWLVQETADFLPEILEQLKANDLLEPVFFNVLPLKRDVENEFKPIAETLQKAMQERAFVPTQSGGYAKAESVFHVNSKGVAVPRGIEYRYAKAQNVYYPHVEILRQLIENNWLHSKSDWLHPEIRNTEEFRQCFKVMQEAGVKPVEVSRVLRWLEDRVPNWFKGRSNKWLRFLYIYLKEQGSQLDRIKKLPLIRLENGQHVCASDQLVFFPPDTDEAREEIRPLLNELPIVQLALLDGDESSNIENFLKDLKVQVLRPEEVIGKWIIPQYAQFNKPSVEVAQNYQHVRYLFKVWDKLSGYQHRNLRKEIRETPILRAYNGTQPEIYDFIAPCDVYLPKAYTGDDNLETYFSVYNGEVWFVDDTYLGTDSNRKKWLQFLKTIGSMDTPRSIKKTIRAKSKYDQEFSKELDKCDIKLEYTIQWRNHWQNTSMKDFYLEGLSKILDEISEHKKINLSQVLWHLLVKVLLSEQKGRDAFFEGTFHWSYYGPKSEDFDAKFYRQLKETAWLPDKYGNFHTPSECFAPTDDNRRVLEDSVAYLHADFDISQDNATAQWLAEKLGIHLNANTASVLNYLQTLSGTETSVEKVEPLYRFLARQDARPREEFKQKSLIFTANPEPRWWKADEVFWKNESPVFGNHRGYLKGNYAAYEGTLKPFFNALGVLDQASQRDYALGIQEIATTEQAEDEKVRERVQQLYKCLHAWSDEWEIIYDSRCWLGKKGGEWGFFTRQELALKDHSHIGELFEGEVPFWTFDDDLSDLARYLRVERCSQAKVGFHLKGDQEEDTDWSEKVRKLRPYIYAFLNSPSLCEKPDIFMFSGNEEFQKEKFAKFSTNCSVRRVKELRVTYKLKGTSVTDPNPRQSFLDVTEQEVKLWLGLEVNKDEYAEFIGDAFQDHFGVKELGRFVEDLLTPAKNQDRVLSNWERKGLETKFLNEDSEEDEKKQIESLDEKLRDEPNSRDADSAADESDIRIPTDNETPKTDRVGNESLTDKVDKSEIHLSSGGDDDSKTDEPGIETPIDSETVEIDKSDDDSTLNESESPTNLASDVIDISSPETQSSTQANSGTHPDVDEGAESETPTVHEDPETGNENNNSTENESVASVYPSRSGGSGTRSREGKRINTPSRNRGTGHSSGSSDGTEDNTHMEETGTSSQARKEIERIGMEHARHYEEEQGYTVEDVSTENLGYDLRSTTPNGEIRCIEVKARAERALVVLTSNEWSIAKELKDDYFLYIVLNAATQPERYIIQNPTDKVAVDERYDVRYQVPLSEITEHGKLV